MKPHDVHAIADGVNAFRQFRKARASSLGHEVGDGDDGIEGGQVRAQEIVVHSSELVLMHVQHHLRLRRRSFQKCAHLHLYRNMYDVD